jgi:membrane-bound metal-dependent hydrolase YbcI (DUF457 family)
VFVGHALLAFALAACFARSRGGGRRRALAFGTVAGLFATVPDVDMAYALTGLLGAVTGAPGDVLAVTERFWAASTATHRGVTHSLLVAVPAAAAFALRRRIGTGLAAALVAGTAVLGGPLAAAMAALFCLAGLAVGRAGADAGLSRGAVFGAALLGLLTHPFGDLFTGEPPAMLWPLAGRPIDARVAPFADPTLNLLLAFGVELLALWAGLAILVRLSGASASVSGLIEARASVGAAYAGAALVLTPPTMTVSYHFVLSVLAAGLAGAVPVPARVRDREWRRWRESGDHSRLSGAATGLAAITIAALAYTAAYLILRVT